MIVLKVRSMQLKEDTDLQTSDVLSLSFVVRPNLPDLLLPLLCTGVPVLLSFRGLFAFVFGKRSSEVAFLRGTVLHLDRDEAVVFKEAKKGKLN